MDHHSVVFAHLNKVFRILGLPSTLLAQSVGVIHHLVWLEHHPLHLVHQGRRVKLKHPNLCPVQESELLHLLAVLKSGGEAGHLLQVVVLVQGLHHYLQM